MVDLLKQLHLQPHNLSAIFLIWNYLFLQLSIKHKLRRLRWHPIYAVTTTGRPLRIRHTASILSADENVVFSDAQLLSAIAGKNGSFSSVIFSVLRPAKRTARESHRSGVRKHIASSSLPVPLVVVGLLAALPNSAVATFIKHQFAVPRRVNTGCCG
jgi:hypothetical protein